MRNPPSRKLISSEGVEELTWTDKSGGIRRGIKTILQVDGQARDSGRAERSTQIANVAYFLLHELGRDLTDGYWVENETWCPPVTSPRVPLPVVSVLSIPRLNTACE
jgi:hypothetical protein